MSQGTSQERHSRRKRCRSFPVFWKARRRSVTPPRWCRIFIAKGKPRLAEQQQRRAQENIVRGIRNQGKPTY